MRAGQRFVVAATFLVDYVVNHGFEVYRWRGRLLRMSLAKLMIRKAVRTSIVAARFLMHRHRLIAGLLAGLALVLAGCASAPPGPSAAARGLCARALGQDPLQPYAQIVGVQLALDGAAVPPELRAPLLSQLVRASVWPDRDVQVYLEPFDQAECAAAHGKQVSLRVTITDDDIAAIRAQVGRGPGLIDRVVELAARASKVLDLADQEPPAQREWIRLYFATNRRPTGRSDTSEAFDAARSEQLTRGTVDVSVQRQRSLRDLDSPAELRLDRVTRLDDFAVAGGYAALDRATWLDEIRRRAAQFEKPGVLLFVHGYNVSFVDAARRAAQMAYDIKFPGPTVFLAWPSDASVIRYLRDGRDAENSWQVAASLLDDLTGLFADGPVYVVAHSMGNRVLLGGLAQLLEEFPGRRRAIADVVMAAPDIDQDSFRLNWSRKLLNVGMRFTLYASDRDLALGTSEFLYGGPRLGMGGARLLELSGLESIDASAVTREFFGLNHSYFGDKQAVLSDLFYLLRGNLPAERRPHLQRLAPAPASRWAIE